jgi:hypothetical protein
MWSAPEVKTMRRQRSDLISIVSSLNDAAIALRRLPSPLSLQFVTGMVAAEAFPE